MSSRKDASTDLYLVRLWRRNSDDSEPEVRGKLQHVVSGASCYFEELSSLPEALRGLMGQQTFPFSAAARSSTVARLDDEARYDKQQEQGG